MSGKAGWPLRKWLIHDLIDYHEGVLDVIDKKLVKPELIGAAATADEIKKHKEKSEIYHKASSYAKLMISSAIADSV